MLDLLLGAAIVFLLLVIAVVTGAVKLIDCELGYGRDRD